MSTTEHTSSHILAGKPAAAGLAGVGLDGLWAMVKRVWCMLRNRRAVMSLAELTDSQLLDIGISRHDVAGAITSPFFDDPSRHLTRSARERANRFYRDARKD